MCDLEDIDSGGPSTDDGHQSSSGDDTPWTIPNSLLQSNEPSLRSFDVAVGLSSTAPSLRQPSGQQPHDAALMERATDGSLIVDPDLLIRCLSRMAQGQSSMLFSLDAHGRFQAILQGQFRVSRLGETALKNLVAVCKSTGEKTLDLYNFIDKAISSETSSPTHVALAASIRALLHTDHDRLVREAAIVKGFVALQTILRKTEALSDMLYDIIDAVAKSANEEEMLRSILKHNAAASSSNAQLINTLRALLLSILNPAFDHLMGSLGLQMKEGIDSALVDILLSDAESTTSAASPVLSPSNLRMAQEIIQGLEMLRAAKPHHLILSCDCQMKALDLDTDDLFEPDPEAVLRKAQEYEATLLDALEAESVLAEPQGNELNVQPSMTLAVTSHDIYTADFADLAQRFTAMPPATHAPEMAAVAIALKEDFLTWNKKRLSPTPPHEFLLDSLRPLLEVQQKLVSLAVLQVVFDEQDLFAHLDAQRQFHLFGNGIFLRRLQTALFDSASSSPRDCLRVEGNFGLRMDARSSRWPPASSDLQLTLAGILSDSYIDSSTSTKREPPGGLSFAIRTLSEDEISHVLDPSSPNALDFLRLHYSPPPGLAAFFTLDVLDKYDSIFRFLLSVVRQSHITKTMLHLLTIRPRSTAHAFAHQAHYTISALTTYFFDLGIAAPWQDLLASLAEADDSFDSPSPAPFASLVNMHSTTMDAILDRLFLTPAQASMQTEVHKIFTTVLQASILLATGTQTLAVDNPDVSERLQTLNIDLRDAVIGLVEQLNAMQENSEGKDHFHLLALTLEASGFFASDKELNWCSL